MTTLQDQLRLEDDLVLQGAERFIKSTQKAEEQGRGSSTGYAARLMQALIEPVAAGVKEYCKPKARVRGKYSAMIKGLDAKVVAYIGLKTVFDHLSQSPPVTRIAMAIGMALEDDLRFASFKELNPEYYAALFNDFNRKHTKSYRHIRNVMSVTSKKKGFKWTDWDKETRLNVGTAVLHIIATNTDLIEIKLKKNGKREQYMLSATPSSIEWIGKYNQHVSMLHPYTKPCVIEPDDWTGITSGGYWSDMMRHRTKFIKDVSFADDFIKEHDLHTPFEAVNLIQRTPWRVNTQVLDVLRECWQNNLAIGLPKKEPQEFPKFRVDTLVKDMDEETKTEFIQWKAKMAQLYTDETSRVSKAYDVSRAISMAVSYAEYERIWFVHQCDFRGRVYASSVGLSPQGTDYSKALLTFADGKPLGEHGMKWLSVHGANCYGIDKVSFDARVNWVHENRSMIRLTASEPMNCVDFWSGADSPWMFLAFCFEYAAAEKEGPSYVSHLPIGMDGSCNGLQNFSALLRDEVGGAAVNLTPQETPADIYTEVAKRTLQKLRTAEPGPYRDQWLAFAMKHNGILPRSLAKRPVMTLPYGSTRYSCFDFIHDAVHELDPDFFGDTQNECCAFLTDLMWDAIGETVIAARAAMDWLQDIAGRMADRGYPVWWVNPAGFPVYQNRCKSRALRIRTNLMGTVRLNVREATTTISGQKQRQGIAPNFVHSLDSAHMMLTVIDAAAAGITHFAMIHDDFGTHAGDMEVFRNIIRDTFVRMYQNNEPLHELYTSCMLVLSDAGIPPVPSYGTLDLSHIRDSEYFFS